MVDEYKITNILLFTIEGVIYYIYDYKYRSINNRNY